MFILVYNMFSIEMIERFMQPEPIEKEKIMISSRIGIAKGQKLYDDDCDFDEMNPEIERLFGGLE